MININPVNSFQKHDSIAFGRVLKIKTENGDVLRILSKADEAWRKCKNPKFRFENLNGNRREVDGFVHGVLVDGIEKDAIHSVYKLELARVTEKAPYREIPAMKLIRSVAHGAEEIVIWRVEQLKNLPIFQGIKLEKFM